MNERLLGCPVVNQVVVKDDLLLPFLPYEELDAEKLGERAERLADNLASVRDVTEACGGQFLYVTLPCQYAVFSSEYPDWLNNRAELTALSCGSLFLALDERKVDWLDLGELLLQPGTRDRATLRTDNHFSMFGAYLTYRAVVQHINKSRSQPLAVLEPGEFTLRTLPNPFLGSRSRKLFALDGLPERLSIFEPLQPVPFRRWGNGALLAPEVYALPASEEEPVDYNTLYMGGDYAETVIQTGREELPSVLIYGDSFTNAVECMLYYSFGRMHSLDLRFYRQQSLGEYIEAYRPDYVICLRDYEQSSSPWDNGGPAFPAAGSADEETGAAPKAGRTYLPETKAGAAAERRAD